MAPINRIYFLSPWHLKPLKSPNLPLPKMPSNSLLLSVESVKLLGFKLRNPFAENKLSQDFGLGVNVHCIILFEICGPRQYTYFIIFLQIHNRWHHTCAISLVPHESQGVRSIKCKMEIYLLHT